MSVPIRSMNEEGPYLAPRTTMTHIQKVCALNFNVTVADMRGPRRKANMVKARHIAMFLCRDITKRSLYEIGRFFGARDHTTVLHAIRKIAALESDIVMAANLNSLRQLIRGES